MRTTLNLDDQLLAEAQRVSGITKNATLVREGLKSLTAPALIWTRDKRLGDVASFLGLAFEAG